MNVYILTAQKLLHLFFLIVTPTIGRKHFHPDQTALLGAVQSETIMVSLPFLFHNNMFKSNLKVILTFSML